MTKPSNSLLIIDFGSQVTQLIARRVRRAPQEVFDSGLPIMGICYGQQTLCAQLGGTVEGGHHREFGAADIEIHKQSPLFDGVWELGQKYPVWMSHGDRVTQLPEGFEVVATSPVIKKSFADFQVGSTLLLQLC